MNATTHRLADSPTSRLETELHPFAAIWTRAIENAGGASALARRCGINESTARRWTVRDSGVQVPTLDQLARIGPRLPRRAQVELVAMLFGATLEVIAPSAEAVKVPVTSVDAVRDLLYEVGCAWMRLMGVVQEGLKDQRLSGDEVRQCESEADQVSRLLATLLKTVRELARRQAIADGRG